MTAKILEFKPKINDRNELIKRADEFLEKAIYLNQLSVEICLKAIAIREELEKPATIH